MKVVFQPKPPAQNTPINCILDSDLMDFLQELETATLSSNMAVSKLCYDSRHSNEFQKLHLLARDGEPGDTRFEMIRHYVGRPAHTMKAVKIVAEASIYLPSLFDDCQAERIVASQDSPHPHENYNPNFDNISWAVRDDADNMASLRAMVRENNETFNLRRRLQVQKYRLRTAKHQIHAELLVLDHFWTNKLEFIGRDRFIACSKAACYCCYHYIRSHPGRFVTPASHNNSYFSWAPPVHDTARPDLVEARDQVLLTLRQILGADARRQLRNVQDRRPQGTDSSTGISSSIIRTEDDDDDDDNDNGEDTHSVDTLHMDWDNHEEALMDNDSAVDVNSQLEDDNDVEETSLFTFDNISSVNQLAILRDDADNDDGDTLSTLPMTKTWASLFET